MAALKTGDSMAFTTTTVSASADDLARHRSAGFASNPADNIRSRSSAVSWGAVAAGAAAAAALSLILLILGVGLGLSSVSPWATEGVTASTFGLSTILWLTLTQLAASAMGGYLAGRLRTKWSDVHTDEVYFRDTAHGFLAWAVATLATAALLSSVIASILGNGAQAGAALVGGAAGGAAGAMRSATGSGDDRGNDSGNDAMGYFVDALFRRDTATPETTERVTGKETQEVSRIFMHVGRSQPMPAEDIRYVGQIVAQRTGLSQPSAEKRVNDIFAQVQAKAREVEAAARAAADKARKASAYSALWLFISLLVGAFFASLAATFGGRQRDA
jgi:hypothetical protein